MALPSAALFPLTGILGFQIIMVLPDLMHVGPVGAVSGRLLWYSPTSSEVARQPLDSELLVFVLSKGGSCTQQCFTPARLSLTTLRSAPALKTKAANALVVVEWLADYCARQAAAAPHIDYFSDRETMLW